MSAKQSRSHSRSAKARAGGSTRTPDRLRIDPIATATAVGRFVKSPNESAKTGDSVNAHAPPPVASDDPLALISKRELAKLLAINSFTLDRWRKTNPDFPAPIWLTGTSPRWRRRDVELFIATRQRGGRSPDWKDGRTACKRSAADA